MPLILCPDCNKQISNRADMCPFCGCPSRFFSDICNKVVKADNDFTQQNSTDEFIGPLGEDKSDEVVNDIEDQTIKTIDFCFGNHIVSYPESTKKISKQYGRNYNFSIDLTDEFEKKYDEQKDLHDVLQKLSSDVENKLGILLHGICMELYSFGVEITPEELIAKYDIHYTQYIEDLYICYENIIAEENELAIDREFEKSGRSHWQGGGFGLAGAVKGAMSAAVLNTGTDFIRGIGDSINEKRDKKYIYDLLVAEKKKEENRNLFLDGISQCVYRINAAMICEYAANNIIDIKVFGLDTETEKRFNIISNYERNHDKYFEGIVDCIKSKPTETKYYLSILNDLFEKKCEIKKFLDFWNLECIYWELEECYGRQLLDDTENSFIINESSNVFEIKGDIEECDGNIIVNGKILYGELSLGKMVTFITNEAAPVLSIVVDKIMSNDETFETTIIGNEYKLIFRAPNVKIRECARYIVDEESFEDPQASLYATVVDCKGDTKLWSFYDISKDREFKTIVFDKNSGLVTNLGISFDSNIDDVMAVYGVTEKHKFNSEIDEVKIEAGRKICNDIDNSVFYLVYYVGEGLSFRFYFDINETIIAVAYRKAPWEKHNVLIKEIDTKRIIICDCCGKVIQSTSKFCNYCGEMSPLLIKICPSCNKRIKKEIKFCNFCGYGFN